MNKALIDTDILSYFLRGDEIVLQNFKKYLSQFDVIQISIITYYEIISGLLAKDALKQLTIFEDFVADNEVLPLTENAAKISAQLYAHLKQNGNLIDDIDLFIAGIAIENELTIVTNNESHFNRIPGITFQNWKKIVY